jgi:hypothetical protein
MKKTLSHAVCAAVLGGVGMVAYAGDIASMKEAPTKESVAEARKQAADSGQQSKMLKKTDGKVEFKRKPRSLLGGSVILTDANGWTMVPKGALLAVPEKYASKVGGKPNGKLVPWKEFQQRNRAWLSVCPVKAEMVSGEKPLKPEFFERYVKSRQVVVSTYQMSPVAISPKSLKTLRDELAKP